jgi:8-oxo-dGTP pyrophosphatase MutT (NUDIX family)
MSSPSLAPVRLRAVSESGCVVESTSSSSQPLSSSPPSAGSGSGSGDSGLVVVHDPTKRLVDGDGYRMRAGCIPFRFTGGAAGGSSSAGSPRGDHDGGASPLPPSSPSPSPTPTPTPCPPTPSPSPLTLEVALVASSSRAGAWILPAGGVEAGEGCGATAARECLEEAGLVGRVWPLAWVHDHAKKARTAVYAQLVDAVLPPDASGRDAGYEDAGTRERRWTELAEAEILLASVPPQLASFRAGLAALAAHGDSERAVEFGNGEHGVVSAAGLAGEGAVERVAAFLRGREAAAQPVEARRGCPATDDGGKGDVELLGGPEAAAAALASPAASTSFPVPHFAVL